MNRLLLFVSAIIPFVLSQSAGDILLIGGTTGANQLFDPLHLQSAPSRNVLPPLYAAQVVQLHSEVHLIGGANMNAGNAGPENTLNILNLDNQKLRKGPPMSEARIHHTAVTFGNQRFIMVCGGANECAKALNTCELYDSVKQSWLPMDPLPAYYRVHSAVTVAQDKVMITGGMDTLSSALMFDARSNQWTNLTDMPTDRYAHSMVSIRNGSAVIVCGGANNADAIASCDLYDVSTDSWMPMAPLSVGRSGFVMVELKGLVWVIGGMDNNDIDLASLELYDPQHNSSYLIQGAELFEATSYAAAITLH